MASSSSSTLPVGLSFPANIVPKADYNPPDNLPLMFVAQLLQGLPWGIFIANAPAYCSEIVSI
jgi:hypothetical protein